MTPNLISLQAEKANTEGGFDVTLLGYNFGRPQGTLTKWFEELDGLDAGHDEDPLLVKINNVICPITKHTHDRIVCTMSEGEGQALDVDVVLYHKDTHKSNGNIAVIKSTWDNDERSIVKSSFYEEMEKITFSFDAPKITNIYVDHENYTMTISYDETTGTPYGIKRSPKDIGSRIETIGKNKKGPGLPTSSKSIKTT